jgi:hypothetical protein
MIQYNVNLVNTVAEKHIFIALKFYKAVQLRRDKN